LWAVLEDVKIELSSFGAARREWVIRLDIEGAQGAKRIDMFEPKYS
jgi:hypothetical protein